ncbi:NADH-ubiquinone oxidoreductase 29.9 kDa subunit [Purpureocillium lavendulum]|uniref:NADH-ubiquinone oxidoreductase 29.9 kDa subunit n=1 Tax=Purpureocillium lavendulum TaxID=1247861 RepID=A0AB34G041_9HYPO|nr:NADH-ubiquinone oxidoreductase 29.9 kDa subunit [Purpureocillium lavendulum]
MRPTLRVLARYLEPGTPTGLTGLWTHGTPRSTLLYLYGSTLNKLQSIPESSLYRQSVEAVTKHRMSLVEQTVPPGYNEWSVKARELVAKNAEQFRVASGRVDGSEARTVKLGDRIFVVGAKHEEGDVRIEEWDGEEDEGGELEGIRTPAERKDQVIWAERKPLEDHEKVEWEDEPQLTAEQVHDLEQKIGAGLIEEVIQVAEGELNLIDTMQRSQVWEDLEEKPMDGQWEYFDRKSIRSPSERHQVHLAGVSDIEEDPTRDTKHFPHRGLDRRDPTSDEYSGERPGGEDWHDEGAAVYDEQGRRTLLNTRGSGRPVPGDRRGRPLDTMLRSIHQFLDRGDIARAARAYALVLQMRPGSRTMDVRQHDLWALGAEILMREGETPSATPPDGQAGHRGGILGAGVVKPEALDDDLPGHRHSSSLPPPAGRQANARIPRRWGSPANMPKVKAYFETLIQQHPYDHKFPRSVSALDFQQAMLGCEIYNVHAEHRAALARVEVDGEISEDQQSHSDVPEEDGNGAYARPERQDPQSRLEARREAIQLRALAGMEDITRRMDALMQQLPFRKSNHFLHLRATASLYMADLVVPGGQDAREQCEEAGAQRLRELRTATSALERLMENGGHLDSFARAILEGQHVKTEEHVLPTALYPSLPIRGL